MRASVRTSAVVLLLSGVAASGSAQSPDTTTARASGAGLTLSAKELGDVIATTLLGGLRGRMAGVRVVQPSAAPGAELHLRIRSAIAIGTEQDPLIIVDGAITRGSLADIAAADVERIEVLKGPSASAIYGSNGAAGVVRVFTRRGREGPEGKLQVRLRSEAGPSMMTDRVGESGAHPFQITTGTGGEIQFVRNSLGSRVLEADRIADNPYPTYNDHQGQLFLTGLFFTNHLTVSGKKGSGNFSASLDHTRNDGPVFGLSGHRRRNLRLNADQRIGPVDIGVSGFYGNTDRSLTPEGTGSPFFSIRFLEPKVDLLAANPDESRYRAQIPDRIGNASNPLYFLANQEWNAESRRLIGGATLRWPATSWLAVEAGYHAERDRVDSSVAVPTGYLSASGVPTDGFQQHSFSTRRSSNAEAAVVLSRASARLRLTSRIGYVYERRSADDSAVSGSLGGTGAGSTRHVQSRVKSAYASTSVMLDDRYTLEADARRDELSFLASETRIQWYYRVTAAWRASQMLRVRAAYGSAGQRPDLALSFVPFGTTLDPLRAPRTGELELGVSLASRGERFTLDYAFSRKNTHDVLAVAAIPSTTGFFESVVNAGSVHGTSHELTLGYDVIRRPGMTWSLTLSGDRIREQIDEYPLPEQLVSFGQQPAAFFIGAGKSLGIMYGNRFVRSIAELYNDPDRNALSGPGQAFDPANFVVNEEGYVVLKSSWRCGEDLRYRDGSGPCSTPERPILYAERRCPEASCQVTQIVPIGNSTPDFVVGLQSRLRYGRLGFSTLIDWSQGGDVYNGSRQWPFFESRDPVFDQRGKPEAEKKSIAYYQAFYNGLNAQAFFVESATYLKVRELSATYDLRLGRLDRVRVGLVGRNLLTLTGYSGYDPEVGNSVNPFMQRIDWFQYPHFRTISGMVEIVF